MAAPGSTLPPPVNVSPLIRFGRYTALIAGIVWGVHKHRKYTRQEAEYQAYEAKQRVVRDAKQAAEKKRMMRDELLYLSKEAGLPLPENFEKDYN